VLALLAGGASAARAEPLYPVTALSFVLRFPSGPGLDLMIQPLPRLELGAQAASWLLVSEAGVYARGVVVQGRTDLMTAGLRLHGGVSQLADEGRSTAWYVSPEIGYEHRRGSCLFAVEIADAVVRNRAPCACAALTTEVKVGYVW